MPLALAAIVASACGPSPAPTTPKRAPPPSRAAGPEAQGSLHSSAPQPAAGVSEMHLDCREGIDERCNALDDDCSGVIDEGCGYGGGPLQVTARWNSSADLDLRITDPAGHVLDAGAGEVPSGGVMDHPGRGACQGDDAAHPRIENARWTEDPPTGRWKVALRYASECDRDAGPTTASVSVSVAGNARGPYNVTLEPGKKATVVQFELTRQPGAGAAPAGAHPPASY